MQPLAQAREREAHAEAVGRDDDFAHGAGEAIHRRAAVGFVIEIVKPPME